MEMTYEQGLQKAMTLFEEIEDATDGDALRIFKQVINMEEFFKVEGD